MKTGFVLVNFGISIMDDALNALGSWNIIKSVTRAHKEAGEILAQ